MADTPRHIIKAKELSKLYGNFVAVDGISFRLNPGECLGLLGPNGAGKTSTVRMIYGFSPISGGKLEIFGLDMRVHWRSIKARVGVCQQDNSLDPDLTVIRNLEVYARYFNIPARIARERAARLLDFIALSHRAGDKVTELSGGMMRRVVLARSLINDPALLILDEPTTGLDPQSRHLIWERLERLRQEGLSILLTTHNMEEASRTCDRVIIMDRGRILVKGKPMDLIRDYAGRDIIEAARPSDELRSFLSTYQLMHDDLGHRLIIYGQEGDKSFESIKGQYCDESCILRMATLEDVFLRLTGRELRE